MTTVDLREAALRNRKDAVAALAVLTNLSAHDRAILEARAAAHPGVGFGKLAAAQGMSRSAFASRFRRLIIRAGLREASPSDLARGRS